MRLARALEGDTVAEIFHPLPIFVHDRVLGGFEPARREAIHGDAVDSPIVGEAHGELANSAAACAVRAETGVTGYAGDGADVDDASVAARNHAARDGLRDEKAAAQKIKHCRPHRRAGTVILAQWKDTETGLPLLSCTMIITKPNSLVGAIHDRMPVLLDYEGMKAWLSGELGTEILRPSA